MKPIRLFVLSLIVIAIAITATSPSAVAAQSAHLTYSIFFPPTHGQCLAAMEWAKEIERLTDGIATVWDIPRPCSW